MISLDNKTSTTTSSLPVGVSSEETTETPTLSFSELLKGVGSKKDEKQIQNGVVVLALNEESSEDTKTSKNSALLALLKGDSSSKEELLLDLNPSITKDLTQKELKVLVQDAKNYLRDKITSSEGFKKSEIDSLPKTLKGLTQVAQKFGIDISKISLEEVQANSKVIAKSEVKIDLQVESQENEPNDKELKFSLKTTKITELESELGIKSSVKSIKNLPESNLQQSKAEMDIKLNNQVKMQEKVKELPLEVKATPLFKAQVTKEITTQQLVQTRISTLEGKDVKQSKVKADETLQMLLRGEKVSKNENGFTADFSVATARVIAPSATTESSKNLESLLRGEASETVTKLDGLNVHKADSLEVKLNEAKQMTKYLSQDVKTAIEDYKSPFTRIKVQLNPQRLGEIDLTIVQRGKNLHINLSSNNAAINTLALNANDLKAQLSNNGINNATLNFNNSSQSSESGFSSGQQQHSQREQEAAREYNFFSEEETSEEILSSLEIVVPNYA